MNYWTELSIEYANQKSYLDDLFQVYPTIPEGIREINQAKWDRIEEAYSKQDNVFLIKELLKLDLFPIKDSYIAFLKRDGDLQNWTASTTPSQSCKKISSTPHHHHSHHRYHRHPRT